MLQRIALVLLVLGGWVLPAAADGPSGWKWKENDRFYVELKTQATDISTIQGQESKSEMDVMVVLAMTVQKVDREGGVVLDVKIENFQVNKGEVDQKDMEKLAGETLQASLNGKLDIVQLDGIDRLIKKMQGKDPGDKPEDKLMRNVMEGLFRSWLNEVFVYFPAKEPNKGDTWEQKTVMAFEPIGKVLTRKVCTAMGKETVEGRTVRSVAVAATQSIKLSEGIPGLPFKVNKLEIKKQDCKGSYLYDPALGRLVRSELLMKLEMDMNLSAGGNTADVHGTREQSVNVRILDKNPLPK